MEERAGDPKVGAYAAVRAHELMLNEAVSRLEHARLAPLIVLNGGALVAFLTLLGALLGKESGTHPSLWLSAVAAGAWVVGLVAAALATTAATGQQRAISAAHRLMREQLESALFEGSRVAEVLKGPAPTIPEPSPRPLAGWRHVARYPVASTKAWWTGMGAEAPSSQDRTRSDLRRIGGIYAQRLKARWWLSVLMFVIGAALALAAVMSGAPVNTKTTRSWATIPLVAQTQARHPAATRTAPPYWSIPGIHNH